MFAYVQHKHSGARSVSGVKRERGTVVYFMCDDVETVKAKKKARARGQNCSTIFRRASKPLTKSGLESPFLMLPGASYGDVCVRVRCAHTGERATCRAGKEKRFERDRLFSPGFREFAENR